jgi:Rieske 2Fe-2S family protein
VKRWLRDLAGAQPKGRSLLQPFYASPEIYALDIDRVLRPHWHCVGHQSAIGRPGDYFLFEIDTESVIIVRGQDQVVRALANVCRHRGSRICDKPSGHLKSGLFVCPYHAWAYKLDGSLRNARMMPEGFDTASHGLRQIPLRIIEGLIFVSLAEEPLGLSQVEKMIHLTAHQFGWAQAKVIHHVNYVIEANWKLALENQVECYHCGPSHPEFSRVHSQGQPDEENKRAALLEQASEQGMEVPIRDNWCLNALPGEEADYCNRYAMRLGAVTASEDGNPVAPLMDGVTAYDGSFSNFYVGPLNHFLAYSDYGAIFRYTPRSVMKTDLSVTWLVRGDAREGVDYDVDRVTWLWRVTAGADKKIVEQNQIGVMSRYYAPGPYADPSETRTRQFTEWYLHEIAGAA